MTKKTSRSSQSPTRFVIPAIIGMLLVLSACAVWNTSVFDLVWIFATFGVAAWITFRIIGPKLLPIEDSTEERGGAYRVFSRFIWGQTSFMALVRDGQIVAQSNVSVSGNIGLDLERGLIIADSTSVVALRTETGVSRIAGAHIDEEGRAHSGVIFTLPEETIDVPIDLRPQFRRQPTTAQTRDGITVDVFVNIFFAPRFVRARPMNELYQLKHQRHPRVNYPPPFAWRRSSIIQALNTRRIERAGDQTKKTEWFDRIIEIAIPRLRDLVSDYTIDQLTAWTTTEFPKHPRYLIRDELLKRVRQEMEADDDVRHATGIDVRFMAVTAPMPPQAIIERRIQAWTEEWRKKEADIFSRAEAEAILTRELARAQVQGEMTARINDILQEAQDSETNSSDLVTLRFLEAMEKMSKDPTTRALLTFDAMKMLKQLRELMDPNPSERQ